MADVQERPKVRCDNCGTTVEKEHRHGAWERPRQWGDCRVSPTNLGNPYPNEIRMIDLCGPCLEAVHHAVGAALEQARRETSNASD